MGGGSEAWIGETLIAALRARQSLAIVEVTPQAHDVINVIDSIKEAKSRLDKILRGKPNARISLRAQACGGMKPIFQAL